MSGFSEYGNYDALGLAELVRQRQVSPLELVEEAITRIEALNPSLNAVVHRMYDHAREVARGELPAGPFRGVPFLLKDLLAACAGQPLSMGCRATRAYVPDFDSELVKRFKASGVVIVGKTNTPELGLTPVTEPELFGPTLNPWDTARTPSGSSGGSAAAVAARMVPMASGGDGGGSIRTPASACGIFGLKPSRGRNPVGMFPGELWHGAVAEHVLTRTVRDSAAMLDATAGSVQGVSYVAPAPSRPFLDEVSAEPGRLRVAYTATSLLGNQVDQECVRGVERTAALLRELGHEVVEAAPRIRREAFMRSYITMVAGEVAADLAEVEDVLGRSIPARDVEIGTRTLQILGKSLSAADLNKACRYFQQVTRDLAVFFTQHDVLLTPTLATPPILIGALQPTSVEAGALRAMNTLRAGAVMKSIGLIDVLAGKIFEFLAYTPIFNVTGLPAMSVPLHWSEDGLPVGMHFATRYGDEATLFRLAGQLERARPWAQRTPRICAE